HREGRWVAANCVGLAVLHRAGILDGLEVAAPATISRRLATLGTRVAAPRRAWVIDSKRKVFTAAGAATVHPSTIALVWPLFGEPRGPRAGARLGFAPAARREPVLAGGPGADRRRGGEGPAARRLGEGALPRLNTKRKEDHHDDSTE